MLPFTALFSRTTQTRTCRYNDQDLLLHTIFQSTRLALLAKSTETRNYFFSKTAKLKPSCMNFFRHATLGLLSKDEHHGRQSCNDHGSTTTTTATNNQSDDNKCHILCVQYKYAFKIITSKLQIHLDSDSKSDSRNENTAG